MSLFYKCIMIYPRLARTFSSQYGKAAIYDQLFRNKRHRLYHTLMEHFVKKVTKVFAMQELEFYIGS
jgi:hypothetical protein